MYEIVSDETRDKRADRYNNNSDNKRQRPGINGGESLPTKYDGGCRKSESSNRELLLSKKQLTVPTV